MCYWIWFHIFHWRFLYLNSSRFWPVIFFSFHYCCGVMSVFGIKAMMTLQNEFGGIPSCLTFWNNLRIIGIIILYMCGEKVSVKPYIPRIFFNTRFHVTHSISFIIDLFRFLIFSWFNFDDMYISRNVFLFQRCQIFRCVLKMYLSCTFARNRSEVKLIQYIFYIVYFFKCSCKIIPY